MQSKNNLNIRKLYLTALGMVAYPLPMYINWLDLTQ